MLLPSSPRCRRSQPRPLWPYQRRNPIFAVIEAHRRAWADLGTECGNQAVLEEEIPWERRHYSIEADDDPRWVAQQTYMHAVHDRLNAAKDALIKIEPTTIAGAIALLSFAAEHVRLGRGEWGEGYEDPEPLCGWGEEHGLSWETMLHMHVAKALKGISMTS
jgi:hypothetical protein